jgi:hypothetical protein
MPNVYILSTDGTIGAVSSNGQPLAPVPGSQFAALVGSTATLVLPVS